jgi:hypothetical protein
VDGGLIDLIARALPFVRDRPIPPSILIAEMQEAIDRLQAKAGIDDAAHRE